MARKSNGHSAAAWSRFLDELRKGCVVAEAAALAGIRRRTCYDERKKNAEFAEAWDDAYAEGTEKLEALAQERAFKGTLRPVYQQARRVGTVREYSDQLAIVLLKRRNPEFKDRTEISGVGKNGEIIVVSPSDKLNRT